jgi:hypothetical protein
MVNHNGSHWSNFSNIAATRVRSVTLDTFVSEHSVSKIDFIKIDIEGAETLFFEGGFATLSRFTPILLVEITPEFALSFGSSREAIFLRLKDFAYRYSYRVRKDGSWSRVLADGPNTTDDFLFSIAPLSTSGGMAG